MKLLKNLIKTTFICLFILPCLSASAQIGSDAPVDNIVKWNPFSMAFRTFSFSYEKRLDPKLTIQGTLNLTASSSDANNNGLNNYSNNGYYGIGQENAYGIVLDLRYYATYQSMPAPNGFYIGPFVRYMAMSFKDDSTTASGTRISIGATLGYQIIWQNVVSIDFFCGPAYEFISGSVTRQANNSNIYNNPVLTVDDIVSHFDPLLPTIGANVGFRCGFTVGVAF